MKREREFEEENNQKKKKTEKESNLEEKEVIEVLVKKEEFEKISLVEIGIKEILKEKNPKLNIYKGSNYLIQF
jgi:single-stranded DNA-specific DHH superfamily exonuclease